MNPAPMLFNEFHQSGHKVFGLHGATDGRCDCGNPNCKALFKHPRQNNWQKGTAWSDEELETMEANGQFKTGYGVLTKGLLVVDLDERNGSVLSYDKLLKKIPQIAGSGLIVKTGSGGESKHLYFTVDPSISMITKHKDYDGIDFKSGSGGYVVGAGSVHVSGNKYEVLYGSPDNIDPAPEALIELLKKPEYHRTTIDRKSIDVGDSDIREMLAYVNPSCEYEKWIRIGMAIHQATQGAGYALWDDWSTGGDTYESATETNKKWLSFGRSGNPVGLGTLIHYAREGGYVSNNVEFIPTVDFSSDDDINLLRPPGFVGELCQWVNAQCRYPRESLAVAASLVSISNLAGMRYYDEMDSINPNMLAFCVAGSGTGKEHINKAFLKIMMTANLGPAVHGAFKSEQELYRNLLRHQPAFYSVDELGIQLRKIKNAMERGGASYLEGLLGAIMSVYSKADSSVLINGDLKEEVRGILTKELAAIAKQIDDGKATAKLERKLETVLGQLESIDNGIEAPYLSIIGYTTPVTFDGLFDYEQATNGFLARAIIFTEKDNNPRCKPQFRKSPMTDQMKTTIQNLHSNGSFSVIPDDRIEFRGEKIGIPTELEAETLLEDAKEYFHRLADAHESSTGLTAIPRRGFEMAAKVSLILALPSGLRTVEHVRYGIKLAKKDIGDKLELAHANTVDTEEGKLVAKIMKLLDRDVPVKEGTIVSRCTNNSTPKQMILAMLEKLVTAKKITVEEKPSGRNGQGNFKEYKKL